MQFTHFHVHSQYSILDGAASIPGLIAKAKADGQTALALTDHGNMSHGYPYIIKKNRSTGRGNT